MLLLLFAVMLGGCTEEPQLPTMPTAAPDVTQTQPLPLSSDSFSYETLSFPEELVSAQHLYRCYVDESGVLLSVNSTVSSAEPFNGAQVSTVIKTDYLALCDYAGNMTTYPVDTQTYITSAVPCENGVLYVDYVQMENGEVQWSLIKTDGTQQEVLDSGLAAFSSDAPSLFKIRDTAHYLCKLSNGYCVKKLVGDVVWEVYSGNDCELYGDAVSNGESYALLTTKMLEVYPQLIIFGEGGVLIHQLSGRPTSWTLTDKYAVVVSGEDATKPQRVEVIDLRTRTVREIDQTAALYSLAGTGSVCVARGSGGQLWAFDIENENRFAISPPKRVSANASLLFAPAGENRFFVQHDTDDGYKFYFLHVAA